MRFHIPSLGASVAGHGGRVTDSGCLPIRLHRGQSRSNSSIAYPHFGQFILAIFTTPLALFDAFGDVLCPAMGGLLAFRVPFRAADKLRAVAVFATFAGSPIACGGCDRRSGR